MGAMEYEIRTIQIIPIDLLELSDENNFCENIKADLNVRFWLSRLNEIQREIVGLKMAGYKLKEISQQLNQPANKINYELLKVRQIIKSNCQPT